MRTWIVTVLTLAVLSGCSAEQIEQFVAEVQPIVAVTILDGVPTVIIATCDSNLTRDLTLELVEQTTATGGIVKRPIGEVSSDKISTSDGVSKIDVSEALSLASVDVSSLPTNQWVTFGYALDNGYSVESMFAVTGAWPSYPDAAVLDPDADPLDEDLTADIEANPLTCESGS